MFFKPSNLRKHGLYMCAILATSACAPPGYDNAGYYQVEWPEQDVPLSAADRIEAEAQLNALGYSTGAADGAISRQTRAAIQAFQTDIGTAPNGFVSPVLLSALRANSGERSLASAPVLPGEENPNQPSNRAPRESSSSSSGGGGGSGSGSNWN